MVEFNVQIRCQRCGEQMELRDPAQDQPWPPNQFWKCPTCGRNFWTTYPPPKKPKPAEPAKPTEAAAAPKPKTETAAAPKPESA